MLLNFVFQKHFCLHNLVMKIILVSQLPSMIRSQAIIQLFGKRVGHMTVSKGGLVGAQCKHY